VLVVVVGPEVEVVAKDVVVVAGDTVEVTGSLVEMLDWDVVEVDESADSPGPQAATRKTIARIDLRIAPQANNRLAV
jgi:hypothetical protein